MSIKIIKYITNWWDNMQEEFCDIALSMGMDPAFIRKALDLLDKEIEQGNIPGAVVSINRCGSSIEYATGDAVIGEPISYPARLDTIYDCASLTKVTVTLPLILLLLEEGHLRLDDPVALFIPEFAANGKSAVTIRHLLTHTGGLVSFANMHSHSWTNEQIMQFVFSQNLEYEPGTRVVYSDLGYITLGHLASLMFGEPLDRAAQKRLFAPLGMNDSGFCPPLGKRDRVAATEHFPFEKGPRWGVVHDENAFAMGGISGHAGLFSTVRDLSRYAEMWLGGGSLGGIRFLSPATVKMALSNQTASVTGGNRGLGWVLKGDNFDASGDLLSDASFGHTGFTGTSLYVDPVYRLTVILLTNRVHFGREKSIVRLRVLFHNAVAAALTDIESRITSPKQ